MRAAIKSSQCIAVWLLLLLHGSAVAQTAQCADAVDNNGNGLIDMADAYCASPFDDDESSFRLQIPGSVPNPPRSLDCWFDDNSGSGDDGCQMHACCDIDGPCPADLQPSSFDPAQCGLTSACVDTCAPMAKAGCDCFGCCQFCRPGSGCIDVFVHESVSPGCSLENLDDPDQCRRCVRNTQCRGPEDVLFANGFESASTAAKPDPELAKLAEVLRDASSR